MFSFWSLPKLVFLVGVIVRCLGICYGAYNVIGIEKNSEEHKPSDIYWTPEKNKTTIGETPSVKFVLLPGKSSRDSSGIIRKIGNFGDPLDFQIEQKRLAKNDLAKKLSQFDTLTEKQVDTFESQAANNVAKMNAPRNRRKSTNQPAESTEQDGYYERLVREIDVPFSPSSGMKSIERKAVAPTQPVAYPAGTYSPQSARAYQAPNIRQSLPAILPVPSIDSTQSNNIDKMGETLNMGKKDSVYKDSGTVMSLINKYSADPPIPPAKTSSPPLPPPLPTTSGRTSGQSTFLPIVPIEPIEPIVPMEYYDEPIEPILPLEEYHLPIKPIEPIVALEEYPIEPSLPIEPVVEEYVVPMVPVIPATEYSVHVDEIVEPHYSYNW